AHRGCRRPARRRQPGLGPAGRALGAVGAVDHHGLPAPDPRGEVGRGALSSRRDQLVELGYAAGWRLVRMLPLSAARALFNQGADRAAKANGRGAQRLRRNLRTVVGPDLPKAELDELVRAGLRSYARYWMEAFRLPSQSREDFLRDFHLEDADEFNAVLKEGNGVVLALPHVANWDAAAAWVVSNGWNLITVAE